ncbi:MAG: S8 family serine peptidase [Methanothrix sp.]|nr:S8 family serine peptidase [Methanothrix sp.]
MAFLDNLKRSTSTGGIKLRRSGREVEFKKMPDRFSLRLKHGTAKTADALQSLIGSMEVSIRHIESLRVAQMDVFEIDDRTKLDNSMEILRASPHVDVVSHIYRLGENVSSEVIPTGIMTIQFKPEARAMEREKILEEFGLEVLEDLDFLPDGYSVKTTKQSNINPLKIALKLQQYKEIRIAEPDIAFKVDFLYQPANSLYKLQWYLKNRGNQLSSIAGADIKAEEAWDITTGSRDIVICLIDDGFDLEDPRFNVPGKIVASKDFTGNAFTPTADLDFNGHGTACAGLALAEEDCQGIVGLAPKCAFMPIMIPTDITDRLFVAIFQYAMIQNADVICCCWKARAEYFPLSTAMNAIIQKVATEGRRNDKGCTILFAAGNDNSPLDGVKNDMQWLNGFAVHPDVIAVGASNSRDKHSFYSNYGPELAVCAPSGGGSNARSMVATGTRDGIGANSQFDGTSGATSIASGLAALILSVKPELSSAETRNIIMETADKIDPENGQYKDGHSLIYGHGRIDTYRALKRAIQS